MTKYIDVKPLKAEIKKLAEEITRLLAENKELKETKTEDIEHWCDVCTKQSVIEQARAEGQNEAWELARKITCQPINGGFNRSEFEEMFGDSYISDIFKKYTYYEAAAKVAEWENAKEEIKRGDIIRNKYNTSSKFCVTDIGCDGHLYGVGRYGLTYSNQDPEYWEKTGRHIDIDSFLKQIGGEQE